MLAMWLATALLVWALVPNISFLHALVVGSCVTPTDPVLSNVIVKGKFADHNVPRELQQIIIAESGANDGLGYPFLFFALYLIEFVGPGADPSKGGARTAMGLWFGETWGYTILLSIVYGAVVGWIAKELLHWAEERKFVDRESFLVFAISLALFIVGTCGMIGSDDVLACFIAGNVFTWDDWFRLETLDDSLQPTIDMLLNVSVFMWFGAVCPWSDFLHNDVVPLYRLVPLGVLVLLVRRLPWVFAIHKFIPQIEEVRQAIFVGFFGPVGVSAIFYLYITLEFLKTLDVDGEPREDVKELPEIVLVVVWFLAICSIVSGITLGFSQEEEMANVDNALQIVHGLSIPLGKLGFYLPRTLSRGINSQPSDGTDPQPPFRLGSRVNSLVARLPRSSRNSGELPDTVPPGSERPAFRIGGSIIPGRQDGMAPGVGKLQQMGAGTGTPVTAFDGSGSSSGVDRPDQRSLSTGEVSAPVNIGRTIRFPDEQQQQPPPSSLNSSRAMTSATGQ